MARKVRKCYNVIVTFSPPFCEELGVREPLALSPFLYHHAFRPLVVDTSQSMPGQLMDRDSHHLAQFSDEVVQAVYKTVQVILSQGSGQVLPPCLDEGPNVLPKIP